MVFAVPVMRGRTGFTLIELLISAMLLALVSAGVGTLMSVCLSAWQAGQARADFAQQAQAVLDTAGRDLRASFLGRQGYFVSRDDGDGLFYLELTTLSRRSQRLDYLAEIGQAPGENISDLTQVVYFTEPAEDGETFALYREEICPPQPEALDEQNLDPEAAQLLCDRAVSFALRFYDAKTALDWVTEWDSRATSGSTTQGSLPAAAEIVLTLRDGNRDRVSIARVPITMGLGNVSIQGMTQ
jgi:prepilin-type N-terminal cleavage/methylation domain-containing protein